MKKPDPIIAQAEAYALTNPGVIELKDRSEAGAGVQRDSLIFDDAPVSTRHRLKSYSFDEVTRNMLVLLEKVAPGGVLVL